MKKIIKTNKKSTIARFREAADSRLMLGEPRMVGFFWGSYVQLQHLFGEKLLCIWDFLIHIEAVGYFAKSKEDEDVTELRYKIIKGYWNPVMIFMWFVIPFIPFFMTVAAKAMLNTITVPMIAGICAIPIGLRVVVTFIFSNFSKKAKEGIALLEEEINYEVS